jgi:enamine deaminase RidA (YjgF/YER057c/UK114 family)
MPASEIKRHIPRGIIHQATEHNGVLYIGGITPDDSTLDMYGQARQLFHKLSRILAELDSNLDLVLVVNCFITDMSLKSEMNRAWQEFFPPERAPARLTPGIVAIEEGVLLEISVIAAKYG